MVAPKISPQPGPLAWSLADYADMLRPTGHLLSYMENGKCCKENKINSEKAAKSGTEVFVTPFLGWDRPVHGRTFHLLS